MAKFKLTDILGTLSGSLNRSDRTIGKPRALHTTMRKTRNGLVLAKKPVSVKSGSLAKKLRVKIYCNCDEGWKTLAPSELSELRALHLEYNQKHKHKPVKLLYHFWMKWCMSNEKTPLVNCGKLEANMYNCDMESMKNLWSVGYASQYTTYLPSRDNLDPFVIYGRGVYTENGIMGLNGETTQSILLPYCAPFSALIKTYVAGPASLGSNYIIFGYLRSVVPIATTDPKYFKFAVVIWVGATPTAIWTSKDYKRSTSHVIAFTFGRPAANPAHNCIIYINGIIANTYYASCYQRGGYLRFNGAIPQNIKIHSEAWHPTKIKECSDKINPLSPEL